jgi:hypothetical protein
MILESHHQGYRSEAVEKTLKYQKETQTSEHGQALAV